MTKKLEAAIITGMSGAGKSVAIDELEDLDFFAVDNIPPQLVPDMLNIMHKTDEISKVAVVMDLRSQELSNGILPIVEKLRADDSLDVKMIYLDANDESLVTRFKESRRVHPLSKTGTLLDNIKQERKINESLKDHADIVFDTSIFSSRKLKFELENYFNKQEKHDFNIDLISFGYKFGVPIESDLVFDVRFLKNPFYDRTLKFETGMDQDVYDYVMNDKLTKEFMTKLYDMIDFLVEGYKKEGKPNLTISIGCTGGQHRSVSVARALESHLNHKNKTKLYNRDMEKSQKAVIEHG